jgi:hypothetical protein
LIIPVSASLSALVDLFIASLVLSGMMVYYRFSSTLLGLVLIPVLLCERSDFAMGETIRVRLSYRLYKTMRGLQVYVGLRSGSTREMVTSVRHVLTKETLAPGTGGIVTVELPDVYIRPGEYPLYLQIKERVHTKTNFDVLDDLTAPVVITGGSISEGDDCDPYYPVGYFSIPSRIVDSVISPGQQVGPGRSQKNNSQRQE